MNDDLMAAHLETLDAALGAFCVGGQRCGNRSCRVKCPSCGKDAFVVQEGLLPVTICDCVPRGTVQVFNGTQRVGQVELPEPSAFERAVSSIAELDQKQYELEHGGPPCKLTYEPKIRP